MGTIIAIGGGFEDKEEFFLAEHILKICGKERPNFLQIPTPGIDEPRTGRMGTFIKYGCRADQLFLSPWNRPSEEEIARKIRWADLIHVPGGNLEYCMDMWRETHADRYLREAYDQGKILFGTSSGSMCWFQEGYDDCGPRNSVKFVEGTGILPYCNGVHFEHEFWQQFSLDVASRSISGIACEDDAAICCADGRWYLLISPARPEAKCWLFDARDHFRKIDLTAHPEILERL